MADVTRVIEDAEIVFQNFAGVQGKYNAPGKRNFCIILTPKDESEMIREGWNVKYLKGRDDNDPPKPYIQVAVSYAGKRPPKVMTVSKVHGKRELPEELVDLIDEVEMETVDVIIRQYPWEVQGNRGIKAYLKTIVVTIKEDYLELKYAHVNEFPLSTELENVVEAEWFEDQPQHAIGA